MMLIRLIILKVYGPQLKRTCLRGFAINKGADQPAHLRSLIRTFAIRLFQSIISKLATSKFSSFLLVFVAEETGLSLALSETPTTGFVALGPI